MPGYHLKHEWIPVAGCADLRIRSLLDRQQFADPLGEALRQGITSATWPLFGLLWPSGHALATRMASHPVRPDERILEMGCGLALASLVAHRRGAQVTATDCHPLADAFLQENLRLNDLPSMPYGHAQWALTDEAGLPFEAQASPLLQGRFDLLIGSDLLYERDDNGILAAFIERHALPCAEVWLVDPNRGNRAAFNRRMGALGFRLEEERLAIPASAGRPVYAGRMLSYRRRA
jgi:predicted nicotinamide N-methyase